MKEVTTVEIHQYCLNKLGINSRNSNLFTIEAISALLRRAGGFFCPCPQRLLVEKVINSLDGLVENKTEFKNLVKDVLEGLISYGDFLEESEITLVKETRCLLYAAPPSFIWRNNNSALILGIIPDHISPFPTYLEQRIEYVKHIRRIKEESSENLKSYLKQLGLIELPMKAWRKEPKLESYKAHISRIDKELRPLSGFLPGLKILNPLKSVTYYPNRWEEVKHHSGKFVARRPQTYGNDLWCYIELKSGCLEKILDFPIPGSNLRGCDEAWRLQMAIDACQNNPQQFFVHEDVDNDFKIVDFFSPVPLWAQRRWNIIGEPVNKSKGCLFSYRFPKSEIAQEILFIENQLWLSQL